MKRTVAEFEISKHYGGKVEIKFYPKSHQYWASTKGEKFRRVSGVTSLIAIKDKSRALGSWQQQVTCDFLLALIADGKKIDEDKAIEAVIQHELEREEASDIGKAIHAWCEAYIKKELGLSKEMPEIPDYPEAVNGVNAFLAFLKEHKVKFVSTERVVYSMKHGYVGTLDDEAKVDGLHCLIDLKASNGLYNAVRMQTAAYQAADTEQNKTKYDGRWALRLSKYTEKEYIRRETRKQQIKEAIARVKGTDYTPRPIKPYQVFEAKFLDAEKGFFKRDFEAFLNCKALTEWDRATDPFTQGDNW